MVQFYLGVDGPVSHLWPAAQVKMTGFSEGQKRALGSECHWATLSVSSVSFDELYFFWEYACFISVVTFIDLKLLIIVPVS